MRSTRDSAERGAGDALLAIERLSVEFDTVHGRLRAVDEVSLEVRAGECLAIVGESGSGKSQLFLACLGLLAANGRATGRARFGDAELIGASERELNRLRGVRLATVTQDPLSALTPYLRIEEQLTEVLIAHRLAGRREARERALRALEAVRIGDVPRRLRQYPHELSGGMRQRVALAMALIARPELLIADEPTTALDVTVQAQVLELLRDARGSGLAIVLITHDLGVVAGLADRIAVMYAGRLVEVAPADGLLGEPAHPYARALLDSVPRLSGDPAGTLVAIAGQPPRAGERTTGCAFAPRCPRCFAPCTRDRPELRPIARDRQVACHAVSGPGPAP